MFKLLWMFCSLLLKDVCWQQHSLFSCWFIHLFQKGTVVRRNLALERQSKNILDMQSFPQLNHCQCRKMRMSSFAITDATYLEVSRHYCISTSNRTLHFFHEISSDQWETFRLVGMCSYIHICFKIVY